MTEESLGYLHEIRQNIDPYPIASEVKLIWDRGERIGVIMPLSDEDTPVGEVVSMRVQDKNDGDYETVVVVTPYGDTVQAVFWQGEDSLGFWSPEYLLPKDFPLMERPAVTISRHSMYVIDYTESGIVIREGFMFISDDDDPGTEWWSPC